MANEGSTKPTYSELEAENLRVRGLLQRQSDFAKVLRRIHHGHQVTIGGKLYVTAHTLIDYAKGYERGAESADIGKLDAAQGEKTDV